VEGAVRSVEGLGILPVHTVLEKEKTTVVRQFNFGTLDGPVCEGYEIHMGRTEAAAVEQPLNYVGEEYDGYRLGPGCWGTYMHGILDNRSVVEELLAAAGASGLDLQWMDYKKFRDEQYDRLAAHIRAHVDVEGIYRRMRLQKH
jgi:adenosylcobyric acid synthase